MINFRNGTLVINEKGEYTFRDFDPNDFLFYQLSFDFDPNAGVDLFDKFLKRVLIDEKDRMILAEYAGYIFLRNRTLKLEKSLILYGTGANGKSTFFEILYALLGKENITTFSLHTLTNETGYQRAQIQNKLLNYASEISVKMDSAVFKQLSSGEPVEARLPYSNPFIMEEYAKMIF
jgi:putative DNA primase/helicase